MIKPAVFGNSARRALTTGATPSCPPALYIPVALNKGRPSGDVPA